MILKFVNAQTKEVLSAVWDVPIDSDGSFDGLDAVFAQVSARTGWRSALIVAIARNREYVYIVQRQWLYGFLDSVTPIQVELYNVAWGSECE